MLFAPTLKVAEQSGPLSQANICPQPILIGDSAEYFQGNLSRLHRLQVRVATGTGDLLSKFHLPKGVRSHMVEVINADPLYVRPLEGEVLSVEIHDNMHRDDNLKIPRLAGAYSINASGGVVDWNFRMSRRIIIPRTERECYIARINYKSLFDPFEGNLPYETIALNLDTNNENHTHAEIIFKYDYALGKYTVKEYSPINLLIRSTPGSKNPMLARFCSAMGIRRNLLTDHAKIGTVDSIDRFARDLIGLAFKNIKEQDTLPQVMPMARLSR